jgi:hypothetical protein
MHQPIIVPPTVTWLKPRILESVVTDSHKEIYRHAIECMGQGVQSPFNRLTQDEYTGGWIDCESQVVQANKMNKYPMWYYLPQA